VKVEANGQCSEADNGECVVDTEAVTKIKQAKRSYRATGHAEHIEGANFLVLFGTFWDEEGDSG